MRRPSSFAQLLKIAFGHGEAFGGVTRLRRDKFQRHRGLVGWFGGAAWSGWWWMARLLGGLPAGGSMGGERLGGCLRGEEKRAESEE